MYIGTYVLFFFRPGGLGMNAFTSSASLAGVRGALPRGPI